MKTEPMHPQDQIKALLEIIEEKHLGLQPEKRGRHDVLLARFRVESHEHYMQLISALLEVCILALDNPNARFFTKNLEHKTANDTVKTILEHTIELLPFDELYKYERMVAVAQNNTNHRYYPRSDENKGNG